MIEEGSDRKTYAPLGASCEGKREEGFVRDGAPPLQLSSGRLAL